MKKIIETEIERIVSLLKEGKPLPEDYKAILFDTKKEYELIYADKDREEDILADTMAVPDCHELTLSSLSPGSLAQSA
jgi:site-specific DNA-methyltransferase (adenine-specific)/adenine-specific DNA-methyltransferase